MAKLPSEVDIPRRNAQGGLADIRAPRIDYTPMAQGYQALGTGIAGGKDSGGIGKALSAWADAGLQNEQNEINRKILDFNLDTEMEYERYKREMPPGAEGYANNWADTYRQRAREFVGSDYANVPEKLRPHVDAALQKNDVMLRERAIRDEYAERDRKTVADLEQTLGKTKSAVEADPSRLEQLGAEGKALIEGSILPPTLKAQYAKKYRTELEEGAAGAIADSATDAESYARAKAILAPNKPERVSSRSVKAEITSGRASDNPAGWAATNATWKGLDGFQKAALMALMEADGADKQDATNVLGAIINRAAREGEDLGAHVSRKIYQPTIEPAQERRIGQLMRSPEFGELTDWARRRADGQEADPVNGATHFLAPERTMLALEAREPGKYRSWRNWTGFDSQTGSYRGVITRDKSHAFLAPDGSAEGIGAEVDQADAYDGPFQNLPLAKRRAYWQRAETTFDKMKKGVETAIKEQNSVASDGYLPPAPVLNEIEKRVRAIGDPILAAQYDAMLRNAQLTQAYQKAPPLAIEEEARRLRDMAAENGATKEMDQSIKHVEALAAKVRKNVNDNPMSWAQTAQIQVPLSVPAGASFEQAEAGTARAPVKLETLDFRSDQIDTQLAYRINQAKAVGAYYGQPPQLFTQNERDFLKDTLRGGGVPMLAVLGKIANAAASNGLEPAVVMKEFSKDAPEVAVIGQMVASNADKNVLQTAANALSWKAKLGDKFESTIDKAQAKPDLGEYASVLAATPTSVDAVKHTANLIYEYEARRQGLKQFDEGVYRDVVARVMGETKTPDGVRYGGVGDQGTSWSDGKWRSDGWFGHTPKVLLPPEVRSDSFDDMVGALRMKDLPQPPLDGAGKPLSMAMVRSASWVSLGPGRYALELKRDADGTRAVAMDASGQPYVLDIRHALPAIQRRKPEIFRGWDGVQRGTVDSD